MAIAKSVRMLAAVGAAAMMATAGAIVVNPDACGAPRVRDFRDRESYAEAFAEFGLKRLDTAERANAQRRGGGLADVKRGFQKMARDKWDEYAKSHAPVRNAASSTRFAVTSAPKLDGMFGVALGKPIDISKLKRPMLVVDPDRWVFEPKKRFRKYGTYEVVITPVTHVVCRIIASGQQLVDKDHPMSQYVETIKSEYDHVKEALEMKFGKADVNGTGGCPSYEIPFFDRNGTRVERKIEVNINASHITARDFAAEELMKREKESLKHAAKNKDAVTAKDLDAL